MVEADAAGTRALLHIPVEARATWLVKDYTEAAPGVQSRLKKRWRRYASDWAKHYQEALELFRNGLLKSCHQSVVLL